MWAFLIIYQALCVLRADAAAAAGIDPDQISFTLTLLTARDHAISSAGPEGAARTRQAACAAITAELFPPRPNRSCQRAVRPQRIRYPYMKKQRERPPSQVTYTVTITRTERTQQVRAP